MEGRSPLLVSSWWAGTLDGKVALITGGDSGIGRAVAIDARETGQRVEAHGRRFLAISGDAGDPALGKTSVRRVVRELGTLNILVNNAAEQHPVERLTDITRRQLEKTFRTNIFSHFYMTQAALPQLKRGSAIVNTTSVTAYRGSPKLLDYSATKGAASLAPKEVAEFGSDSPMGRAAEPEEIAPCYVFLASDNASFMSGQILHPNGGEVING